MTYFSNILTLNNFDYDDTTWELKFYQPASALNIEANTLIEFTFISYTTSSSVQTSPPITLNIYNNNYLKMKGTATLTTLPKQYISTISTASTLINAETSYAI